MISFDTRLKTALEDVLPTHYELFVNPDTATPCITYRPYDNFDTATGDTIEYTNLTYMIKVWGKRKEDLEVYSLLVHKVMQENGFKRNNTNELFLGDMGQKIMIYEGTTYNKKSES